MKKKHLLSILCLSVSLGGNPFQAAAKEGTINRADILLEKTLKKYTANPLLYVEQYGVADINTDNWFSILEAYHLYLSGTDEFRAQVDELFGQRGLGSIQQKAIESVQILNTLDEATKKQWQPIIEALRSIDPALPAVVLSQEAAVTIVKDSAGSTTKSDSTSQSQKDDGKKDQPNQTSLKASAKKDSSTKNGNSKKTSQASKADADEEESAITIVEESIDPKDSNTPKNADQQNSPSKNTNSDQSTAANPDADVKLTSTQDQKDATQAFSPDDAPENTEDAEQPEEAVTILSEEDIQDGETSDETDIQDDQESADDQNQQDSSEEDNDENKDDAVSRPESDEADGPSQNENSFETSVHPSSIEKPKQEDLSSKPVVDLYEEEEAIRVPSRPIDADDPYVSNGGWINPVWEATSNEALVNPGITITSSYKDAKPTVFDTSTLNRGTEPPSYSINYSYNVLHGTNETITLKNLGSFNILPDYTNDAAWRNSVSGYNTPGLWGQCTWFAWGRFYELYGFDPGFTGNGYQCVSQLLAHHPDKFELSKNPASGAVFSSDIFHNHVGIVLEYDEKKNLLTIQEGNLDVVSNPIWEEACADYRTIQVTPAAMRSMYGNVTYAVPKPGTKMKESSITVLSLRDLTLNRLKKMYAAAFEELHKDKDSDKKESDNKDTQEFTADEDQAVTIISEE